MRAAAIVRSCVAAPGGFATTAASGGRSALHSQWRSLVPRPASVHSQPSSQRAALLDAHAQQLLQTRTFVSLANVIPRAKVVAPREHRAPPPPLPSPQLLQLPNENCAIEYIDLVPAATQQHQERISAANNHSTSPARHQQHATIVMIHGAPGTYRDFRHLIPLLQEQAGVSLRILGINLPGFGGSLAHNNTNYIDTISALPSAALTLRALQHLCSCDERVFLLGHSFGAHAAFNIAALNQVTSALQHPLDVRGLVLLAPAGCRPHRVLRPQHNAAVIELLQRTAPFPVVTRALAAAIKVLYTTMLGFSSDFPASHYVAGIVRAGTTDFATVQAHVEALAPTTPAFVAWSTTDEYMEDAVPLELASQCHACGPRIAFTGGGHNIQKTRADELADAIAQWVRTTLEGDDIVANKATATAVATRVQVLP